MNRAFRQLPILLGFVTLLLPACMPVQVASPTTPTQTADEVFLPEAQAYADQFGVPLEEAASRLALQSLIGNLGGTLARQEADTFGGLWIEHEPEYRVFVRFTRDGETTIRPYIEDGPLEALVEVQPADVTLSELETVLDAMAEALSELDFGVSASLSVPNNRVEVFVTDPAWFEEQLREANITLPDHVVLVQVEGQSAADIDVCAASPIEGVVFPRQAPVEGFRAAMAALSIGKLVLDEGCLWVESIYGDGSLLPIWPAEYSISMDDGSIVVLDGDDQEVAREGEEVFMGGGEGTIQAMPACVRDQLPPGCGGLYWVVGDQVQPNLKRDSELFSLEEITSGNRSLLFLTKKPILDDWVSGDPSIGGNLVWYFPERCLRITSDSDPVGYLLLWPQDSTADILDSGVAVLNEAGEIAAKEGDVLQLDGGAILHGSEFYRELQSELPWDCHGPYWIVADTAD